MPSTGITLDDMESALSIDSGQEEKKKSYLYGCESDKDFLHWKKYHGLSFFKYVSAEIFMNPVSLIFPGTGYSSTCRGHWDPAPAVGLLADA
jgi:hypothetical protein